MNQMLELLYEQIRQKLLEEGIEPTTIEVLKDIKAQLSEMIKEELTLDSLPGVEAKLEIFTKQLKDITNVRSK